jgi:hypothetical protein
VNLRGGKRVRIEIGRFPDGRLKVLRKHYTNDTNVRISENEISICSKNDETALEIEVLEAVNLWNMIRKFPEIKKDISEVLNQYTIY